MQNFQRRICKHLHASVTVMCRVYETHRLFRVSRTADSQSVVLRAGCAVTAAAAAKIMLDALLVVVVGDRFLYRVLG